MEKTSEQLYTDLLRQIGSPTVVEPEVLIGYLRDVERMHSMGRVTDWQYERARDAYAATLERDPRQAPGIGRSAAAPVDTSVRGGSANLDPMSGAPGAHPFGTALGAAAGGAATGAAVGLVAGPLGTVIGAAAGAIIGGLAGKGVAELVDPTLEEAYWRDNFAARPYVGSDADFDDYGPAYGYGVEAYGRRSGQSFDEAEEALAADWDRGRGGSTLSWDRARPAARDAWERLDRTG